MSSYYKILSIDGGAMMGVIPSRILSYLDGSISASPYPSPIPQNQMPPKLPASICNSFDLIVGTSTGGIMTAGLGLNNVTASSPMTANDLLQLYMVNGQTIFGAETYNSSSMYNGPMFQPTGLRTVLTNYFGSPTEQNYTSLSNRAGSADILITSFNMNPANAPAATPWKTTVQVPLPAVGSAAFGPVAVNSTALTATNGSSLSAWDVCQMTSAFPMLFPPHQLAGATSATDPFFGDGGLFAGDPMMVAYGYARSLGYTDSQIIIVSVGCGSYMPPSWAPALTFANAAPWGMGAGYFMWNELNARYNSVIANAAVASGDRNPGWVFTQYVTSTDTEPTAPKIHFTNEFGYLTYLMGGGPGAWNDSMLGTILGAGSSSPQFFRLQPVMSQGSTSNPTYYPPYDTTGDSLTYWISQADACVESFINNDSGNTYPSWTQILNAIALGG